MAYYGWVSVVVFFVTVVLPPFLPSGCFSGTTTANDEPSKRGISAWLPVFDAVED